MPLNIDFLQILLHIFNFLILAGGLTFLLFKPINKFLEDRQAYYAQAEETIRVKTAENEERRLQYDAKMKEADEQVREIHLNAEKKLSDLSKATLEEAKAKADAIILAAEQEAEERKEHILDSAQTEIGELVIAATQKLLSDTVTPERNAALYDEFIRLADQTVADKRTSK